MIGYLALIAAIVGGDQLVKLWAVVVLKPMGSMPVIPNVFHLTYAENRGAAFSILEGKRYFFVVVTIVMVALMAWLVSNGTIRGVFGRLAASFVAAGAIGNVVDRLARGFVVDLFDCRFIHFAIFNVADIFITLGGVMLVVYFVFLEGKIAGGTENAAKDPDGQP